MSSNESEKPPAQDEGRAEEAQERDEVPAKTSEAPGQDAEQPDTEQAAEPEKHKFQRTRVSGWWAGMIIAAIVLIFLLIFILQNLEAVEIHFLMFSGSVPIGVAMLLSAVAGLLVVAVPGIARMIQLRRHYKR